jgi:DNA repair exonuclease SbcCD ATPase subunit
MKNLKIKITKCDRDLKLSLKKQKQYELDKQQNLFIIQRISDFTKELESLQNELLEKGIFNDIADMENKLKILQDNKTFLDMKENLKKLQIQLKDYKKAEDEQKHTELNLLKRIPFIEDKSDFYKSKVKIQRDIIEIQNRVFINKEKYKNLQHIDNNMLENLNIQLNNSIGKKFTCPTCNCDLLLLNDKLQNFTNITESDITSLKSLIKSLQEQLKQKEILSNIIDSDTKFLEENKEFDNQQNYQDLLNKHLQQLKIQEQNQIDIDKLNKSSYSQSVKILETQIIKIHKQISELKFSEINYPQEDIDSLKSQITIKKSINDSIILLENKISKIQRSINQENDKLIILNDEDFEETIKNLENQIQELKSQLSRSEQQDKKIVEYLSYAEKRDYYDKWKTKLISLQESEKNCITSLKVAENFITILNNTESKAVFNIINSLNINLKYYSEQFFTEPISIQVQLYKENQSGNIKPSVVIKVIYKGMEYDIDCLSGGETSRVELAICLAINNIINGKILLLDEVLGTLNSEYIETVTNILKEEALKDNKLILTILHGSSEGNFDHIINI